MLQRTIASLIEKNVFGIDSATGKASRGRQHALNCVHLAKGASTPEQRDHFAKLARTWIKLAEELEQTAAFLAAIEDDEPTKKAG